MIPLTAIQDLPPLEPGIYPEMSAAEYHRHAGVTHSFLVKCQRSLAHGDAYRRNGMEASDDMRFGSAYHMMLLEPARFVEHYRIWSGKPRNKNDENGGAKQEYAALLADVGDADRLVAQTDVLTMRAMAAKLKESKRRRDLLECAGRYELVIAWKCPVTDLPCRAMFDKLAEPMQTIVDIKKARSAQSFAFGSQANQLGYDIEAAFYVDGASLVGLGDLSFVFLPQEAEDPYESAMFVADEPELTAGRRKYKPMMPRIAEAIKTGAWPGYPDFVQSLAMPRYAYPEEEIGETVPMVDASGWKEPTDEQRRAANEEF